MLTVPMKYRQASAAFDDLLREIAEATGLVTRHQAYTTLQGVLICFRRRLSVLEAARFAQVLPPLVQAVFIDDWNIDLPPVAHGHRDEWRAEVKALRRNHNISPDMAIENVALVLWRWTDNDSFMSCLEQLPSFARDFWNSAPA